MLITIALALLSSLHCLYSQGHCTLYEHGTVMALLESASHAILDTAYVSGVRQIGASSREQYYSICE